MSAEETASSANPRTGWRSGLRLVALWLGLCTLTGVLAAAAYGEFGSIVLIIMGVFVGASGALAHILLLRVKSFRRCGGLARTLLLWGGAAILPCVWILATEAFSPRSQSGDSFASVVQFFLGPIAGLSLLGACAMSWIERGRSA